MSKSILSETFRGKNPDSVGGSLVRANLPKLPALLHTRKPSQQAPLPPITSIEKEEVYNFSKLKHSTDKHHGIIQNYFRANILGNDEGKSTHTEHVKEHEETCPKEKLRKKKLENYSNFAETRGGEEFSNIMMNAIQKVLDQTEVEQTGVNYQQENFDTLQEQFQKSKFIIMRFIGSPAHLIARY
jgi:hypothetical protein